MRIVYVLLLILAIGCNSNNTTKIENDETIQKLDSIINQNEQNLTALDQASKVSDSSINKKVKVVYRNIYSLFLF